MNVSLVLSGGAARGYTFIGVVEELQAHGFKFTSISGTSMGSLIGALTACNKLNKYKEWVMSLDFIDILTFLKPPFNRLDGDKIFNKIKELVGDYKIEDLPVKFTAVATDLTKKKEVWFQKGDLWTAVKASSAIPGVFEPVVLNGHVLVDGGVLNLMPVAPAMSDMSDLIIAINANADPVFRKFDIPKEIRKKQNIFEEVWSKIFSEKEDVINQSINLMMDVIFRYRCAEYRPDIEIKIPKNLAKWYEFHKAPELIEIGRILAREALEDAQKQGIITLKKEKNAKNIHKKSS
ncbi:patatin-like phospholipase family protein [Caminibacter pacificus]